MELPYPLLPGLAAALGLGMLIGVERERRKDEDEGQAAAGVRFQKGLTLSAAVEGIDADAAADLTKLLDQPAAEGTDYRVVGPAPEGPADTWVNVQLRMPTDRLAAWLRERAEGWQKGAGKAKE